MKFVARIALQAYQSLLLIGVLSPSFVLAEDLTALAKRTLQQYEAGRYADAEKLARQALNSCERRFGQNRPDCAWALNNLAMVYDAQGSYEDASLLYQRALAIHPDMASALQNLAIVYSKEARYGDAIPLYQRALSIEEKALGPDHPDVAGTLNNLANVYDNQGRYADAIALYERALAIREKALGPDHPSVAQTK